MLYLHHSLGRYKEFVIKLFLVINCFFIISYSNEELFKKGWEKIKNADNEYVTKKYYEFSVGFPDEEEKLFNAKIKTKFIGDSLESFLISQHDTLSLSNALYIKYKRKKAIKINNLWYFPYNKGVITLYDTKPYSLRSGFLHYQITHFSFEDSLFSFSRSSLDLTLKNVNNKFSIKRLRQARITVGTLFLAIGGGLTYAAVESSGDAKGSAEVFGSLLIFGGIDQFFKLKHLDRDAVYRLNRYYDF